MTELLRTPKAIVAQTESGAVRITRRDAADLILLRADDLENTQHGTALALKIAREALRQHGDMRAALQVLYPWSALFSDKGMGEFADEMDRLVWAAADLGHFGALVSAFNSWQGTAEALADGWRADDELGWLDTDDPVDVARPA